MFSVRATPTLHSLASPWPAAPPQHAAHPRLQRRVEALSFASHLHDHLHETAAAVVAVVVVVAAAVVVVVALVFGFDFADVVGVIVVVSGGSKAHLRVGVTKAAVMNV